MVSDVANRGTAQGGRAWAALVGFLLAVYAVAAVGALASADAGTVYTALDLPPWAPPAWLFGPVWTVLYATIGVAAWLVWRRQAAAGRKPALVWWVVQLALNLGWTPLFFGLGEYGAALVEILLLVAATSLTILYFSRVSRAAALLLVPYLGWVCFATALNAAIWAANG
ncbi:TspO/MBR family protein [Streptomyces sp. NPDC127584]|uniref:TspO/MBR family protein n=1 Tax=Streptomyces sp. NPDC127584 TaxID=3345403 RepID=UPI0036363F64